MEFREVTLENGLEIVAECNSDAFSSAIAFFVKTGARDESDELSGVSHFLEHMAFKGTLSRSAADVNRELDELGSHSNAFTSEEQTVYYMAMLPEYQSRAVELLCDLMRPALRSDDFETEKQVILEEIAKYDDQPPFGAHEKSMALHFGTHPLGRSILGTRDSVGALTPAQMMGYFEHRYSPSNMALVAAGNVDFDRLVEQVRQWTRTWRPFPTRREALPAAPCTAFRVYPHEIATQQYIVELANGPAAEDSDRYAARILATIAGDETGSRLFWELIDTGRAEYASIAAYEYQGAGIFVTFLCCPPEVAAENLAAVRRIERELEQRGVTAAELRQAQNKICAQIVLQSERPANRLFSVGSHWTQRREYRSVREVVDAYRAVTQDDVAAVLRKYPLTTCSTTAVGPLEQLMRPH